eukprot:gene9727-20229_t
MSLGFFRSLTGAVVAFTALFVWIIVLQTSWRRWSDAAAYMIYVPDEDKSGWGGDGIPQLSYAQLRMTREQVDIASINLMQWQMKTNVSMQEINFLEKKSFQR